MKINTFTQGFGLLLLTFLLSQCFIKRNLSEDALYKLSNQSFITHLSNLNKENQSEIIYEKFYVDSFFMYRPTLLPDFTVEDKHKLMLDEYPAKKYLLIIPDSLRHICDYYTGRDYRNDTVSYQALSQLLPTRKKGYYIRQIYHFDTDKYEAESISFRAIGMHLFVFKIKRDQLKMVESYEGSQFYPSF